MIQHHFMRIALTFLLALTLVGCEQSLTDILSGGSKLEKTKTRVTTVLDNITKGRQGNDEETAICMFYQGKKRLTDMQDLWRADDEFVAWRKRRGIYRNLESYEILNVEELETDDDLVYTARVTAKLNGEQMRFDVPEGLPFKWVSYGD